MAQDNNSQNGSHLGFFVALLVVVAVGGGAYWYLSTNYFWPVEQQKQTAAVNPGGAHPIKGRDDKSDAPKADKPAATASEAGK